MGKKRKEKNTETSSSNSKKKQKTVKRPDVAAKKNNDRFYQTTVIKCTMNPLCRYKVVQNEIEDCVFWMSRLQIHTSHIMNLFLLQNCGQRWAEQLCVWQMVLGGVSDARQKRDG